MNLLSLRISFKLLLMKIIKLIKLILLKLIIRLDEALIEVKPNQDERNEANKAIFNADRQADRATNVDASDKYKAVDPLLFYRILAF